MHRPPQPRPRCCPAFTFMDAALQPHARQWARSPLGMRAEFVRLRLAALTLFLPVSKPCHAITPHPAKSVGDPANPIHRGAGRPAPIIIRVPPGELVSPGQPQPPGPPLRWAFLWRHTFPPIPRPMPAAAKLLCISTTTRPFSAACCRRFCTIFRPGPCPTSLSFPLHFIMHVLQYPH